MCLQVFTCSRNQKELDAAIKDWSKQGFKVHVRHREQLAALQPCKHRVLRRRAAWLMSPSQRIANC
jgi:hypothetical protein